MKAERPILGAAFASAFAVVALAQGGATGVVKERMDGMGAIKEAVKVLAPMMQGQTGYDLDVIRDQAEIIAAHADDALIGLFPEGSLDAPSEAKDTVWQDRENFAALAPQLHKTSQGLAHAAGNRLMMSGNEESGGMMGEVARKGTASLTVADRQAIAAYLINERDDG